MLRSQGSLRIKNSARFASRVVCGGGWWVVVGGGWWVVVCGGGWWCVVVGGGWWVVGGGGWWVACGGWCVVESKSPSLKRSTSQTHLPT
jgi:hypothetical protein